MWKVVSFMPKEFKLLTLTDKILTLICYLLPVSGRSHSHSWSIQSSSERDCIDHHANVAQNIHMEVEAKQWHDWRQCGMIKGENDFVCVCVCRCPICIKDKGFLRTNLQNELRVGLASGLRSGCRWIKKWTEVTLKASATEQHNPASVCVWGRKNIREEAKTHAYWCWMWLLIRSPCSETAVSPWYVVAGGGGGSWMPSPHNVPTGKKGGKTWNDGINVHLGNYEQTSVHVHRGEALFCSACCCFFGCFRGLNVKGSSALSPNHSDKSHPSSRSLDKIWDTMAGTPDICRCFLRRGTLATPSYQPVIRTIKLTTSLLTWPPPGYTHQQSEFICPTF